MAAQYFLEKFHQVDKRTAYSSHRDRSIEDKIQALVLNYLNEANSDDSQMGQTMYTNREGGDDLFGKKQRGVIRCGNKNTDG